MNVNQVSFGLSNTTPRKKTPRKTGIPASGEFIRPVVTVDKPSALGLDSLVGANNYPEITNGHVQVAGARRYDVTVLKDTEQGNERSPFQIPVMVLLNNCYPNSPQSISGVVTTNARGRNIFRPNQQNSSLGLPSEISTAVTNAVTDIFKRTRLGSIMAARSTRLETTS